MNPAAVAAEERLLRESGDRDRPGGGHSVGPAVAALDEGAVSPRRAADDGIPECGPHGPHALQNADGAPGE
ncbi:hypothetical protein, partial [Streptomyces sp. NPDC127036]|uniref:hypothetical protein n=1 Tax=Streptomyces sp. NPDC127036 TaxID=3347112 RepID=UPI003656D8A3